MRHGGLVLPIFAHFSQFLHPLHCALVSRHQLLCNSVHNHMVNWMIFTHMILLENNRIRNHYWLFNQVRIRSIVTQSKNQNWFNRSTSLLGIKTQKLWQKHVTFAFDNVWFTHSFENYCSRCCPMAPLGQLEPMYNHLWSWIQVQGSFL